MTEYDGVFLDIGGVILDLESVRRGHALFVSKLAANEGIEDTTSLLETWRSELGAYFRSRDGTEYRRAIDGYQRAVDAAAGREVPEEEWMALFEEASDECLRPHPHVVETVRALSDAGVYLGIISDIDTWEAERLLDRFGIRDCFEHVTTSDDVGRTKPDPAIFDAALEKTTVAPERALYVGDRYEHDMRGGTRAGLATVAYGGSAAENADERAVEYVIDDFEELRSLVGE